MSDGRRMAVWQLHDVQSMSVRKHMHWWLLQLKHVACMVCVAGDPLGRTTGHVRLTGACKMCGV